MHFFRGLSQTRKVKTMKTTSTKLLIVTISLVLVVYTDSMLAALPIPPSLKTVDVSPVFRQGHIGARNTDLESALK